MNTLERKLELFAHEEPDAAAVQEAQRKLEQAIDLKSAPGAGRHRPSCVGGWLAAAASAMAAVVAVLWLPLNPTQAVAFGEVQQHFRDFRAMHFDMEQRMNGELLMKASVSMRADGSVRTEVGEDVVVIVNVPEKRVMTLLTSGRIAMVTPIYQTPTQDDSLEWLDKVRDFQGAARLLPETRVIRGERARGWELPMDQGKIVLWANDQGLPLEMQLDQEMKLDMSFRFDFERELPAALFSTQVPAGYELQQPED